MRPPVPLPAAGREEMLAGIGYVCLGVSLFPLMNATVKYLGQSYPPAQIIWLRYLSHMVLMLALFAPRRGLRLFRARRLGIQLVRSALLFSATAAYFVALQGIELPIAATIQFVAPFVVTLLSVPVLGERVGPRRWSAVAIGFLGALLVIRPWQADVAGTTLLSSLLVLSTAFSYSLYQVMTRKVSADDSAETSIAFSALVGCIAAAPLALPELVWPQRGLHWLLFALTGVFGGMGHYFLTRGFARAEAALLAPFAYFQLVGSVTLGYLVFDYLPDAWVWSGALVIVTSGSYVAWREYVLAYPARPHGR